MNCIYVKGSLVRFVMKARNMSIMVKRHVDLILEIKQGTPFKEYCGNKLTEWACRLIM